MGIGMQTRKTPAGGRQKRAQVLLGKAARPFMAFMVLALFLAVLGCAGVSGQQRYTANDTGATSAGVASVVQANNQFAFDLYSSLESDPANNGRNIFFSPYSISSAAAIAYEGARGATAQEMESVFHFPPDAAVRRPAFARLYNEMNQQASGYTLDTANALWIEKTYALLPSYTGTAMEYYGANATNMDFKSDPSGSTDAINKWAEGKTNGKITNLIPQGGITPLTRLVITNAVYFKGKWARQFDKSLTHAADFHVSANKTVQAQMMSMSGEKAKFNYTETDKLQALDMQYQDSNLSMLVLLPKDGDIAGLEASLDPEMIAGIRSSLSSRQINVIFPKFTFEAGYSLGKDLSAMGMQGAFDPGMADFSGMDGSKNLSISEIYHKAYIDVNEEGTEAAAATAIVMTASAAMPNQFVADHPFIFLIQDRSSGEILFMGRVMDPTA